MKLTLRSNLSVKFVAKGAFTIQRMKSGGDPESCYNSTDEGVVSKPISTFEQHQNWQK
jgi:hypothetical protein